jgi:hypothetical protein
VFYSSDIDTNFKYSDYFILLFSGISVIGILQRLKRRPEPYYYNNPFLVDFPIQQASMDKFNRRDFANGIAVKIQSRLRGNNIGSLAIGINGIWGSGKTSFANLIKEKLNEQNRIIIDFNPWRSSSSSKIVEDYFQLLIKKIGEFDPELSNNISEYAKTLTKIDENVITKSINTISDFVFSDDTKDEYYQKVNQSILKIRKQIIVFIDDLDRLDKKEIIEVLRIVRNTASFNNIIYVVSYDKNYVLEAIRDFNKYNYKSFLEKIFQFEFTLPSYDLAILRNELKTLLLGSLSSALHPMVGAAVDYVGTSGKLLTNSIIVTQRDVVRFCNSLLFEIDIVKQEVNFIDFYLIQLLKLKYFEIYNIVSNYRNVFFIKDGFTVRLRKTSEKNRDIDEYHRFLFKQFGEKEPANDQNDVPILQEFIESFTNQDLINVNKDFILELFDELLKEKELRIGSKSKDYKSFGSWGNFDKYFTIQLLSTDFSADEFERFRLGDYSLYEEMIQKWLLEDRVSDIEDRLKKILDFSTKGEWENHLKILIYINKFQQQRNGPYGIDYSEILDTIKYPHQRNATLFFENEREYINYFKKFFEQAKEPYVFEGSVLFAALGNTKNFPLTEIEIEDQLFKYLVEYTANHEEITTDFRQLHRQAVKKDEFTNELLIQPRAQELFKNYFKSNLTTEDIGSFVKQYNPKEDYYMMYEDWIKTFFTSVAEFVEYLKMSDKIDKDSLIYKEFMEFNDAVNSSPRNVIEYHFNNLKPVMWTSYSGI